MTASGFDSQVGYAVETVSGTYTAPTKTIEHVKASLGLEIDRIISKGIKAGRRHQGRWFAGTQRVKGQIVHELGVQGLTTLMKQAMGSQVDTGAGPYVHTYIPGAAVESQTLTVQVNKPDEAGTNRVFSYTGMQVTSLEISSKVGEIAQLAIDFYGQNLDVAQTLAAAAYPATWSPFTFVHGTCTIAAVAYEFDDMNFKIDNGLQVDRYTHRATNPSRPKLSKEANFRTFTGTLNSDMFDLTTLNRFIAGTEAALVFTFTSGATAILTITCNVRFDGNDPEITGADMTKLSLPFTAISTTSDAAACTIVVTNSDAT